MKCSRPTNKGLPIYQAPTVQTFESSQRMPHPNSVAALRHAIEGGGVRLLFAKMGAAGIVSSDTGGELFLRVKPRPLSDSGAVSPGEIISDGLGSTRGALGDEPNSFRFRRALSSRQGHKRTRRFSLSGQACGSARPLKTYRETSLVR